MLNLEDAPDGPLERLVWLDGVNEQVKREMEAEWRRTYFEARLKGMLGPALRLGLHSRKVVLAFTRAENESRGRTVARWGDGY